MPYTTNSMYNEWLRDSVVRVVAEYPCYDDEMYDERLRRRAPTTTTTSDYDNGRNDDERNDNERLRQRAQRRRQATMTTKSDYDDKRKHIEYLVYSLHFTNSN